MQSLERLKLAAQTEPTIRAIAHKARASNGAVVAYLKSQGRPLQFRIRLKEV